MKRAWQIGEWILLMLSAWNRLLVVFKADRRVDFADAICLEQAFYSVFGI